MRPPISSPFGDQNQPQLPNRIADVPVAVGPYATSFFVSARLSVKSLLLTPAVRMMTLGFPIFLLLPVLPAQKTGAVVVSVLILYLFLVMVFALISMPVPVLINWLRQRNTGATTTTLQWENALDVSEIRTTEIPWSDVRRIVCWSGDVFIHGSRKGVFVSREAFASSEAARQFTETARELRKSRGKVFGQK